MAGLRAQVVDVGREVPRPAPLAERPGPPIRGTPRAAQEEVAPPVDGAFPARAGGDPGGGPLAGVRPRVGAVPVGPEAPSGPGGLPPGRVTCGGPVVSEYSVVRAARSTGQETARGAGGTLAGIPAGTARTGSPT